MSILQRREARPSSSLYRAVGVALGLAWSSCVAAQPAPAALEPQPEAATRAPAPREDAEFASEFARGLQAEREGALERARAHYERARAHAETLPEPSPRLRSLLALGWIHYNLRDYLRSVECLKQAVADPALPKERAREAQALIAEEMKLLGHLRIELRPPAGDSAHVEVQLDGRKLADAGDVPVQPGRHEVRATAPGFHQLVRRVDVAAGQSLPIYEALVREQAADGTRQAAWIVGGVAALSLAVGAGAGVYSWVKHDASECPRQQCTVEDRDTRNDAIVAGNVSTVAWIVAGVGAGVSTYLFLESGSSRETSRSARPTRVGVGLASVHVVHTW